MPTFDKQLNVSYYYKNDIRKLLKPLSRDIHKGSRGGIFIFGGSWIYRGAPILAALGALRAGAGLAVLAIPDFMVETASTIVPEAIFMPLCTRNNVIEPDSAKYCIAEWTERCDCAVFGSGIGRNKSLEPLTDWFWHNWSKPLLLDADALYFYSLLKAKLPKRDDVIITPHSGEAATILGSTIADVNADRMASTEKLTEKAGTALLKGMDSVVVGAIGRAIVKEGSPSLAIPGSGDVLSGTIGALLASGIPPYDATLAGTLLHAVAGASIEAKKGLRGALAREIAAELPYAF